MKKLFEQSWLRGFISAIIVVGILVTLVAIFQYVDANSALQNNVAYQLQNSDDEVQVDTQPEATGLINADIERRELEGQKNDALIIGGAGLVAIAIGWILLDISKSYANKQQSRDQTHQSEPSTV